MALLPQMSMAMKGRAEPVLVRWVLCSLYRGCNQEPESISPRGKEQQTDKKMDRDLQLLYLEALSAAVGAPIIHHWDKMGPQQLHTSSARTNCVQTAGLHPSRTEHVLMLLCGWS